MTSIIFSVNIHSTVMKKFIHIHYEIVNVYFLKIYGHNVLSNFYAYVIFKDSYKLWVMVAINVILMCDYVTIHIMGKVGMCVWAQ